MLPASIGVRVTPPLPSAFITTTPQEVKLVSLHR
jgi:hypothetical protein